MPTVGLSKIVLGPRVMAITRIGISITTNLLANHQREEVHVKDQTDLSSTVRIL